MESERKLAQWVLYENPKDYPNKFVIRKWIVSQDPPVATGEVIIFDEKEEAIDFLRNLGLFFIPRFPADDPVIHSVWM